MWGTFPAVLENPLHILTSDFQNSIALIISFYGKLFILLTNFVLKWKLCVLEADRFQARVNVGDISRCPGEPPSYFDKRFSKLNSLGNKLLWKTIYFPQKEKHIW